MRRISLCILRMWRTAWMTSPVPGSPFVRIIGICKSGDPAKRAAAIVQAVTNWQDAKLLAKLSENLGEAMVGINADEIQTIMEERGK